jgi:lauroyl/myristoyl acyltransferase
MSSQNNNSPVSNLLLKTVVDISKIVLSGDSHESLLGHPVSKKILIKNQILQLIQTLYYQALRERHFKIIHKSCINTDALFSLPRNKTIFLFFHQPFVRYLPVWFSEKGFTLHVLGNRKRIKPLPYFISVLESESRYHRYHYNPVITLKILLDLLNKGEIVLLAADGRLGKHFMKVKFGERTLQTPRGIYMLAQAAGAFIVPVFMRLKRIIPSPKFELLIGDRYQFKGSPEEEIEKIESIFSWYYFNVIEQPHMWMRIAPGK